MFGEMDKIDEMKQKLNAVSPSFCLAKWMHCTLHLMTGHTHSCYLPPTHKVPLKELARDPSALHNTEYKKSVRRQMKKGERPKECSICWGVEDLPGLHYSDRHYRGVDSWTMPFFEKIKAMDPAENINPAYLEVSWSSACNFKCMYCSPAISTEWMKEIKVHGGYKLSQHEHQSLDWFKSQKLLPMSEDENPYIEAFWKWWPSLVKDLMFFRVTGGEPLLSRHTFTLLQWLIDNPQPHLELSINSNFCIPDGQLDKFMGLMKTLMQKEKIKTHILHTSLDTWGTHAEYIRHGLDMERFQRNVHMYLSEIPNASIAFMCTYNILSLPKFVEFLQWILDLRRKYNSPTQQVFLDIPHLQGPSMFACNILTNDFDFMIDDQIEFMEKNHDELYGIKQTEIQKMCRIRDWMRNKPNATELARHRKDFALFIQEHDRRRNKNFHETFPELSTFFQLCEGN